MAVKRNGGGLKTLFKNAHPLTLEEELQLAEIISQGSQFVNSKNNTQDQQELADKALKATHKLVESYSYLIETIALEQHKNSGNYASKEDFISEAYIVALRCALSFNPHAGSRGIIRFSSYAPLAIKSSLSRLSSKSQSIIDTPVNVIKKARAFAHTMYELKNRGVDVEDETIAEISGVNMTQQEVNYILGLSDAGVIDDIVPPSITDEHQLDATDNLIKDMKTALRDESLGEYGTMISYILGLEDGEVISSSTELRNKMDAISLGESKASMLEFSALVNHPFVRVKLFHLLNNQKTKP